MSLSKEDGKLLIKIARKSISSALSGNEPNIDGKLKEKFNEKHGAFVTLTENNELRGCIGYTEPIFELWEAVSKAAIAAALEDPRFSPIDESELSDVKIEVSVLAKPELIKAEPSKYKDEIKIGKHGLIAEKGMMKGLLLPQVFPEYNAGWKAALEMTCQKAGLPKDAWKEKECRIYRFSAEIFTEE